MTLRKVVIYARYSTDMQSPKSCADQEREIRSGLTKMGVDHRLAVVIHDEAESGTKTFRSEFERLEQMVRNGEIAEPVAEITIASNLIEMFATFEPASDLEFRRVIDAPTILVPEMTVGAA